MGRPKKQVEPPLRELLEFCALNGVQTLEKDGNKLKIVFFESKTPKNSPETQESLNLYEKVLQPVRDKILTENTQETYTDEAKQRLAEELRELRLENLAATDPVAYEELQSDPEKLADYLGYDYKEDSDEQTGTNEESERGAE